MSIERLRNLAGLALVLLGLAVAGCHRERQPITPTTLGTDFRTTPRGKMTPYPWPGPDLSKATSRPSPTADPEAAMASGERLPE